MKRLSFRNRVQFSFLKGGWVYEKNIKWYLNLLFSWSSVYVNIFPDISFSPELSLDKQFVFSRLREQDISDLIEFHNTYCLDWDFLFSAEDIENRFRKGHRCYVARKHEELVGFMWIAVNRVYSSNLRCIFATEKHCVISYNGFVRPDCRGKNILPGIRRAAFQELVSEFYKKCYGYTRSTNKSVIKSNRKFNACPIGKIIYGYLLGFYFFFPFIKKDMGITVHRSETPWRKWKSLFRDRIVK